MPAPISLIDSGSNRLTAREASSKVRGSLAGRRHTWWQGTGRPQKGGADSPGFPPDGACTRVCYGTPPWKPPRQRWAPGEPVWHQRPVPSSYLEQGGFEVAKRGLGKCGCAARRWSCETETPPIVVSHERPHSDQMLGWVWDEAVKTLQYETPDGAILAFDSLSITYIWIRVLAALTWVRYLVKQSNSSFSSTCSSEKTLSVCSQRSVDIYCLLCSCWISLKTVKIENILNCFRKTVYVGWASPFGYKAV